MTSNGERHPAILVVEDVEETRRGIERLLTRDGYKVTTADGENEAVLKVGLQSPDLILMSLDYADAQLVALARRIRDRSGLPAEVPVVVFCSGSVGEGAEVDAGNNVYLIRPDNFDQLRAFISRLLRKLPRAC